MENQQSINDDKANFIKAKNAMTEYVDNIKSQKEITLGDGSTHPITDIYPEIRYLGKNKEGNHSFEITITMNRTDESGKMNIDEINNALKIFYSEFRYSEEYDTFISDAFVLKYYKDFDNNITIDEAHKSFNLKLNSLDEVYDGRKIIMIDYLGEEIKDGLPFYHFICGTDKNTRKRTRKIPQDVKDSVWRRDGGCCSLCGSNENLEFDHIIPFSKGGANTYRNIQLLCEKCNRIKSDKIG